MTEACETCRFMLAPNAADPSSGLCRRRSPQVILTRPSESAEEANYAFASHWPPVKAEWWCGDYQELTVEKTVAH